jgi:hypothetical protein
MESEQKAGLEIDSHDQVQVYAKAKMKQNRFVSHQEQHRARECLLVIVVVSSSTIRNRREGSSRNVDYFGE